MTKALNLHTLPPSVGHRSIWLVASLAACVLATVLVLTMHFASTEASVSRVSPTLTSLAAVPGAKDTQAESGDYDEHFQMLTETEDEFLVTAVPAASLAATTNDSREKLSSKKDVRKLSSHSENHSNEFVRLPHWAIAHRTTTLRQLQPKHSERAHITVLQNPPYGQMARSVMHPRNSHAPNGIDVPINKVPKKIEGEVKNLEAEVNMLRNKLDQQEKTKTKAARPSSSPASGATKVPVVGQGNVQDPVNTGWIG